MDPVANNRFASGEEYVQCQCAVQGVLSLQMHQASKDIGSGHSGFAVFTHCTPGVSDDQGLIELLSHNLNYFRAKPSISENYHSAWQRVSPGQAHRERKLYPQIMTRSGSHLNQPKPRENSPRSIWICPVATRWVIERSNAWMERSQSLVKILKTLNHATAKLNLCFIRLMLKG